MTDTKHALTPEAARRLLDYLARSGPTAEIARRERAEIPNSQPLKSMGIGNLIQCWEQPEPAPRRWIVQDLVPDGCLSIWFGDGGVFKSWLACFLACTIAVSGRFLNRPTLGGPVLYVDTELDADEFLRRCYRVARGLGLTGPPTNLFYIRLTGSLVHRSVALQVAAVIQRVQPVLTVLDSLTIGAFGGDLREAGETTALLRHIAPWGTTLALDHSPKPMPGINLSQYRPFGSQFKWAVARSVVQVVKADSGQGVVLRPTKNNFGPVREPLGVVVTFTEQAVRFEPTGLGHDALAGVEEHLPAIERVHQALADHSDGVPAEALAEELGIALKTVRNYLTVLRQRGRARSDGGHWRALTASTPVPSSQPLRDRELGTQPEAQPVPSSQPLRDRELGTQPEAQPVPNSQPLRDREPGAQAGDQPPWICRKCRSTVTIEPATEHTGWFVYACPSCGHHAYVPSEAVAGHG